MRQISNDPGLSPMNPQATLADLYPRLQELLAGDVPVAVAWVLNTHGSTPRETGALALIEGDGKIHGSIGGGQVEARAQQLACECLRNARPTVFELALKGQSTGDSHPICGGSMRVLVHPVTSQHTTDFTEAVNAASNGRRGVLLVSHASGPRATVSIRFIPEERLGADLSPDEGEPARSALKREHACHQSFPPQSANDLYQTETLALPVVPRPRLLIVGAGHIGRAVACQAAPLGFDVIVLDDRPEFADPDQFPAGITVTCGDIGPTLASFPFDTRTYVLIVTRGHRHDAEALELCLGKGTAYLGMIGSRRKVNLMRQEFLASGRATATQFDQVYAPVGLDIGAVTVHEIAVSIAAQLVAVRRQGQAPRMNCVEP